MLPPKKTTAKKTNPVREYKKPSSGDSLVEDVFEIFDPTGISSYDDVYRSYQKNGLLSLETGLEVLGALPIIGKAGKAIKGVRTANKYIKALNKVNKVVAKTEKVVPTILKGGTTFGEAAQKVSRAGKTNPIAAASIVVGEGAKAFKKGVKVVEKGTSKAVEKVIAKAPNKQDAINTTAATLNTINTLSDVAGATQNQLIEPIVQKQEDKEYQPIPKKVIYYNTDPERGPVEKPGTESNTSYTPITNSAQLKKWKEQQLAYGTNSQGIMKSKVNPRKKYANGTNTKGVGPNNYIQTPNDVLNDYNIMLAGVEKEVANNKLVPIVSAVGGLMQQAIGMAGSFAGQSGIKPGSKGALDKVLDVDPNKIMLQGAEGTVAANGNNSVQKDVEVEGGEMYETPQGDVGEFQGPSHEQGGIPLEVGQDVEEGTKVYSDRLKVGDKTLAERKEARERQIANLEKIASQPLVDSAVKNATKRRMMAIQKEESADLQFQEQVNNMQQMADTMVAAFGTGAGGVQKMGKGGVVGDPPAYGKGSDGQYYTANTFKLPFNYWSAKLQETEGDKYRVRSLDNVDDRKEFQRFFYKDNQGKDLSGQKIPYTDKDSGVSFIQNYTIDGILGQTAMAQSVQGVGTDYANYMDADGNLFPNTQEAIKNKVPVTLANNPNLNFDALKNFKIGDGINDNASLSYGDPYAKNGVNFEMPTETIMTPVTAYGQGVNTEETKKEPSKFAKALEGNMPGVGDLTKLFGNYLGMTAGIKTAAEQRSTDITHTNVYKNAGKESQKLLDNAKQGIETSKAQAIVKATDVGRGGKRGARNSARGVNQMRGMDWLYDTALQSQIAEISANAAQQISGIDVQKSGVAMNADQLRGKGEYDAAMANEAAKDAYYTALGLGRKDFATGVQQTGKDLNAMKQNKIIQNLMKDYGKWFKADATGLSNKNPKV